ncbi:MAG: hypothetical protein RLZZ384_1157 [Pseudomonadota bacterium]|jgi:hypothetical protein
MNLLFSYLKLCWFKSDPTSLTPSSTFSYNTILFYLISGIIVEGLIADFADGSLEVSLRTIMAFSSVATLLFFHKNILLFQRVFTAIFVCENFIMTLAILCEVLDFVMVKMHYEYREWVSIGLAIFLVSWYLGIVAYILRRFFAYDLSTSLTFALAYFVLTYGIPMLFMDI